MAHPGIGFSLADDDRKIFDLLPRPHDDPHQSFRQRMRDVMGVAFADEAVPIDARRDEIMLTGFAGLPTLNRAAADAVHLYVNNRPVRDRQWVAAVRAAYGDTVPRGVTPRQCCSLSCHRNRLMSMFIRQKQKCGSGMPHGFAGWDRCLQAALASASQQTTAEGSAAMLARLRWGSAAGFGGTSRTGSRTGSSYGHAPSSADWQAPQFNEGFDALPQARPTDTGLPASDSAGQTASAEEVGAADHPADYSMGAARAQLHQNYIIAETAEGIVIVDQHAAHEGWCLEK